MSQEADTTTQPSFGGATENEPGSADVYLYPTD